MLKFLRYLIIYLKFGQNAVISCIIEHPWVESKMDVYHRFFHNESRVIKLTPDDIIDRTSFFLPLHVLPGSFPCNKLKIQNIDCAGVFFFEPDLPYGSVNMQIVGDALKHYARRASRSIWVYHAEEIGLSRKYNETVIDGRGLKFETGNNCLVFFLPPSFSTFPFEVELEKVKGSWSINGLSKNNQIFKVVPQEELDFKYDEEDKGFNTSDEFDSPFIRKITR